MAEATIVVVVPVEGVVGPGTVAFVMLALPSVGIGITVPVHAGKTKVIIATDIINNKYFFTTAYL